MGIPGERIIVFPDGVDPVRFRPGLPTDDLRDALGLAGKRVLVYLGVLTTYQGVDDLLAAWPRVARAVPDAHLLLMGHPNLERYREAVMRLGLGGSVTVTGPIDDRETPRYLALGDVAVSPKHTSTEANGTLLLYMACGLPVVVYDGPVARELLGDAGRWSPCATSPPSRRRARPCSTTGPSGSGVVTPSGGGPWRSSAGRPSAGASSTSTEPAPGPSRCEAASSRFRRWAVARCP